MPSAWIEALREWNSKHNKGTWCVPKKGSKELEEARAILARIKGEKGKKVEAPPPPKKKAAKMPTRTAEQEAALRKAVGDYQLAKMKKKAEEEAKKAKVERDVAVLRNVREIGKKEKVKEFLRKALEKRRAKKDGKKEVKIGGEVVVGTDEEIEEYRRLLAAAGGGEPEPEPEEEKKDVKVPSLKRLRKEERERIKELLRSTRGDTHEYKKGLGGPLKAFLKELSTIRNKFSVDDYEDEVEEYRKITRFFRHLESYYNNVAIEATWEGEPVKVVLLKDFNKLFL